MQKIGCKMLSHPPQMKVSSKIISHEFPTINGWRCVGAYTILLVAGLSDPLKGRIIRRARGQRNGRVKPGICGNGSGENLQHPSWWDVRIPNKDHRVDVFFTVFVDPNLQVFSLSLSSPKHMLEEPGRDSAPMSATCLVANLKENSEKQTTAVHLRIPVLWWIMSLILRIVSNILKDLAYDGSSFQDKPYKVCKSSSIFNPMAFTRTQPLLIIQLPLLRLSSMAAVQAWRSRVPQSTN